MAAGVAGVLATTTAVDARVLTLSAAAETTRSGPVAVGSQFSSIARCEDGLIAVGVAAGLAAAWHSLDGEVFYPIDLLPENLFRGAHLLSVSARPGFVLIAGSSSVTRRGEAARSDAVPPHNSESYNFSVTHPLAAAWTAGQISQPWSPVQLPWADRPSRVAATALDDSGAVILAGSFLDADGVEAAEPLLQVKMADGSWVDGGRDLEVRGGEIVGLTRGPGGWLAVGHSHLDSFVASSEDGTSWVLVEGSKEPLKGIIVQDVVAADSIFIVLGADREGVPKLFDVDHQGRLFPSALAPRVLTGEESRVNSIVALPSSGGLVAAGAMDEAAIAEVLQGR